MYPVVLKAMELLAEVGLRARSFKFNFFEILLLNVGESWPIILVYASLKGLRPSDLRIFCLWKPKRNLDCFLKIECAYTRFL